MFSFFVVSSANLYCIYLFYTLSLFFRTNCPFLRLIFLRSISFITFISSVFYISPSHPLPGGENKHKNKTFFPFHQMFRPFLTTSCQQLAVKQHRRPPFLTFAPPAPNFSPHNPSSDLRISTPKIRPPTSEFQPQKIPPSPPLPLRSPSGPAPLPLLSTSVGLRRGCEGDVEGVLRGVEQKIFLMSRLCRNICVNLQPKMWIDL